MALQDDHQEFMTATPSSSGLCKVGELIRTQRETRGLTQEQLSSTLHMGLEQLQALESGQDGMLPEPVFIKAMVRRLANHLRMNADELVAELGPTHSTDTSAKPIFKAAASSPVRPRSRQTKRPIALLLPTALICGGTGIALWQAGLGSDKASAPRQISKTLPASQASIPVSKPNSQPVVESPPATETRPTEVTISSQQPSWIALRRGGTIVFQGTLNEPRVIETPDAVEIYAGRPDLVMISTTDENPRQVGAIDDLRWRRIIPER